MGAKEYLQQLQKLDMVINQKLVEYDALRKTFSCVGGIDYSLDRVQTTAPNSAKFTRVAEKIIELQEEIDNETDSFIDRKYEIMKQIHGLPNLIHVQILFKRYIEFKSLRTISDEIDYTYQYVVELHGRALKAFEKTYENLLNSYIEL